MTIDHDAIAARVRHFRNHAYPIDCAADDCPHDLSDQDMPPFDVVSDAYLDLYDEVQRLRAERDALRAALNEIATAASGIAHDIQIGPDDEGRDLYDMALAIRDDAREALKGDTK